MYPVEEAGDLLSDRFRGDHRGKMTQVWKFVYGGLRDMLGKITPALLEPETHIGTAALQQQH